VRIFGTRPDRAVRARQARALRGRDRQEPRAPRGEARQSRTEMKLLAGERALVTGAANGIGRGMVAALREEGAEVLGADINEADIRCDLSTTDGARKLAEEAIRRLGTVSLFVHCASPRRQESQTVLGATEQQWREMLAVNLDAAFILCQALGRHMVEKKI